VTSQNLWFGSTFQSSLFFHSLVCDQKFSTIALLRTHKRRHEDPNYNWESNKPSEGSRRSQYECPKCKEGILIGGKTFERHVAICGTGAKRLKYRYPCFKCDKEFSSKVTSAHHMDKKHNYIIENVEKMCFECREEVDDPIAHAMTHNCEFPCSQCSLRFNQQEKLDKHWKQRHENVDRPFHCSLCPACFKTPNHLRSHEASVHTSVEDRKFVCEICERRFSLKYLLRAHMKSSHSDVRR
jgi:KRAB domain-containing zinc finger protein